VLEPRTQLPPADEVVAVLCDRFSGVDAAVDEVPGCIEVDAWSDTTRTPARTLSARRFERALDRAWHRTSYTGIVRRAEQLATGHAPRHTGVVSEPEATVKDDEPATAD